MFDSTNERAGVDEVYQVAGNTSNLTVEADRRGAGDVLVSAGMIQVTPDGKAPPPMSAMRLGMCLLRMHSEWDGSSRRPKEHGKAPTPMTGSDLRLLANGLKSRPTVWGQLAPWLALKGIQSEIGAEALLHWLSPTCHACEGHGLKKVPNAPALSARRCNKCHGTGHKPHPEGSAKVLVYLDDCVSRARVTLKARLRSAA